MRLVRVGNWGNKGNTYSLLETERLIAFGESAPGKTPFETQMVLNHKAAIEFLVDAAAEMGFMGFDRQIILNLHALLSDNLIGNSTASGRLRSIPVSIGKSVYEQAFFILVHLPFLQSFEDVNKRVSRLAANIPFIQHNLCPLSFLDVPENEYVNGLLGVYELNRIELLRDVFLVAFELLYDGVQLVDYLDAVNVSERLRLYGGSVPWRSLRRGCIGRNGLVIG